MEWIKLFLMYACFAWGIALLTALFIY